MAENAPPPPTPQQLDELVTRTRRYVWQSLTDVAKPPVVDAGRWMGRRLVALVVGLVLVTGAAALLLSGGVLLVSQVVPLWVACLGGGSVALVVGVVALWIAGRG